MRKRFMAAIGSVALAILSSSPVGASQGIAQPIKVGNSCFTAKQLASLNGQKLICTNVNPRLNVWKKYIAPSKTQSLATPSVAMPPVAAIQIPDPSISSQSVFQNPQKCELTSSVQDANLGYQRSSSWMSTQGTLNIGVVYASYLDATLNPAAIKEYETIQEPNAAQFYKTESYGKLSLKFVSSAKVYSINSSTASYNLKSQTPNFNGLISDAMNTAKSEYDFKNIDEILLVMPDQTVTQDLGAVTGANTQFDGKTFPDSIEGAYLNPSNGQLVHPDYLTHEIGHTLGLIHPNLSGQMNQLSAGLFDAYAWDVMGWDEAVDPGFYTWEKFIFGWIDSSQVDCLDAPPDQSVTAYLSADEKSSADTKMMMVRISDSKALVVESHRNDAINHLSASQEGVLVYTVDVNKGSDQGAITVIYNKPKIDAGIAKFLIGTLDQGDSVTSNGVKITVLKHSADGDFISVTKQS